MQGGINSANYPSCRRPETPLAFDQRLDERILQHHVAAGWAWIHAGKWSTEGFACYHFYPKADLPLKVIVLDDTDKTGSAFGALDTKRYKWLINELEAGQNADELMIVCSHIPVHPYGQKNRAS